MPTIPVNEIAQQLWLRMVQEHLPGEKTGHGDERIAVTLSHDEVRTINAIDVCACEPQSESTREALTARIGTLPAQTSHPCRCGLDLRASQECSMIIRA